MTQGVALLDATDLNESFTRKCERVRLADILECIHAGDTTTNDAKESFADILAQMSRVKEQPPSRRLATPPPSWDDGLMSKPWDYVQVPPPHQRGESCRHARLARNRAAEFDLPGISCGANLRVDGTMPFLVAPSAPGRVFRQVPGYLPQRDFKLGDQMRIAEPERAWPSNRGSAELYDDKRSAAWKP
eukprot:CAMPEP_0169075396 /NCGR_PEP_ID=MMETSP1015-20121227/7799_1 /TAXON_ID=342587 /ORGANISM="Karlodinium micrum, Strain CCMP2283" /LENGTH=187 /DNA_ID=CAMNT_0009134803 /DNA_START=27 /DNA_END=586 /DNA_ORIENTATION=+